MLAVLIHIRDLFCTSKSAKYPTKLGVSLNYDLFTAEIQRLLKLEKSQLFVLVDGATHEPGYYTLYAPNGRIVLQQWHDHLESCLKESLADTLCKKIPIIMSQDLSDADMRFCPLEKKWSHKAFKNRIMLTYVTKKPDEDLLAKHDIKHFHLENHFIPDDVSKKAISEIHAIEETLKNKPSLLVCDNDGTMFNNTTSRYAGTTNLNTQVVSTAKQIYTLLTAIGSTVTCLSMTARCKANEDAQLKEFQHFKVDKIAEAAQQYGFPVVVDDTLSFSYPVHENALVVSKKLKLTHIVERMNEGDFKLEGGLVVLIDDCAAELRESEVEKARQALANLGCRLVVVKVETSFRYDDHLTLTQLSRKLCLEAAAKTTVDACAGLFYHHVSGAAGREPEPSPHADRVNACEPK